MFSTKYPPKYLEKVFTCPHCNVATNQKWYTLQKELTSEDPIMKAIPIPKGYSNRKEVLFSDTGMEHEMYNIILEWNIEISVCNHCSEYLIWEKGEWNVTQRK
ncbi:hypothetical protein ORM67_26080 [Bacillus cereus]|uniref:hypothetical protein n=1 Tax=Bacillus cereus TaxID=1396 RepID=UPI002AC2C442|nr:hypothetical protein [Bacillus cereus]MDZ4654048.1 hypothetical protein [Bacillus cereus]